MIDLVARLIAVRMHSSIGFHEILGIHLHNLIFRHMIIENIWQ